MRNPITKLLAVVLLLAVAFTSCKRDDDQKVNTRPPEIVFSKSETTFNLNVGDVFTIEAGIAAGEDIAHEWKLDGKGIGQAARLDYTAANEGTFVIQYTAKNKYGTFSKEFTLNVSPISTEGISFSTDAESFTKSIGENVRISAIIDPVLVTVVSHQWMVDGAVVSTTANLNYPIVTSGAHEITYTLTRNNGTYTRKFAVTGLQSDFGNWFKWDMQETYVICLKDDMTKVVTHHEGSDKLTIEDYTGADNQKFRAGYYFGYGNGSIALEYYNFYNVGTKRFVDYNGSIVSTDIAPDGTNGAIAWWGWYFIVNATGDVRICNFLETWDFADSYRTNILGSIMKVSDDKTFVDYERYIRCDIDGVRTSAHYQALDGKFYDFKIVNVKDMP